MEATIIDGTKRQAENTSKRGWPIVSKGQLVKCHHCDVAHIADYRDSDVGLDVPGGHKRHNHYTCPETGRKFAAMKGSRVR